jgi:hypothetical protein
MVAEPRNIRIEPRSRVTAAGLAALAILAALAGLRVTGLHTVDAFATESSLALLHARSPGVAAGESSPPSLSNGPSIPLPEALRQTQFTPRGMELRLDKPALAGAGGLWPAEVDHPREAFGNGRESSPQVAVSLQILFCTLQR